MQPTSPRPTASGPIRLSAGHEALMYLVIAGLLLSGALWLVWHFLVPLKETEAAHPAEAWSLRVHGGLAMVALLLVGSLSLQHVAAAWKRGSNRGSGGVMLAAMLVLTVTGYLLYYAGSETLRDATSWVHWVTGLALPLLLLLHLALGGRFRR